MTVHEYIEWLKTQDQEAVVECLMLQRGTYSDSVAVVEFDPAVHSEYTDLRGNPFCVGKPYEGKRMLLIGEK